MEGSSTCFPRWVTAHLQGSATGRHLPVLRTQLQPAGLAACLAEGQLPTTYVGLESPDPVTPGKISLFDLLGMREGEK